MMLPELIQLPADRKLTPDELRGFRIACGCMITWGAQLVGTSARPGRNGQLPTTNLSPLGRQIGWMAEALQLQAVRGHI